MKKYKVKLKSLTDISDADIKKLIKLRCVNDNFVLPDMKITQVKIISKDFGKYTANVHSTKYAPEYCGISLYNKIYVTEFLLLQELGYNLKEIIKK